MAYHQRQFCPECQIGISNAESRLGKCQNCDATWDPYDDAFAVDHPEDDIWPGSKDDNAPTA